MNKLNSLTLNGKTYDSFQDQEAVKVTPQTLTEEQKAQARENIGVGAGSNVEPAEDDIPKVFFGGALPQTKDDTVMSFRYVSKTMDISGYCKAKAQGNSSMNYPKKNQTVKLYRDAACTEKLKVDFKGWGKQNKFCFKANWIDLTHARNIVSARLWGDVVKSRANYETIPELLRTSPNQGAVDGFPVKVYADGVYQGRYTINIPKDAWMANMDDELDQHCILCGENYVSGCFRAEANIDESDWTDEVHDTVPASIKTRWNEAIRFVMNSTDEEFVSGIGNYFDVESLIDYYLFGLVSCGLDAFGKNQLYMTYDGQKWYATMYDMDSTWGLWWNGSQFVHFTYGREDFQDFADGDGNLLYIRLESLFFKAIKERWESMKTGVLSQANIINRFERFTDIAPPYLVDEDYEETTAEGLFTNIPLQTSNNIQQIRTFAHNRIAWIERYLKDAANILSGIGWNNGFINMSGVISDSELDVYTDKIYVSDHVGSYIGFNTGIALKNNMHRMAFYDKDDNFISIAYNKIEDEYGYPLHNSTNANIVALVPENADYCRISCNKLGLTTLTAYIESNENVFNNSGKQNGYINYLTGDTVASSGYWYTWLPITDDFICIINNVRSICWGDADKASVGYFNNNADGGGWQNTGVGACGGSVYMGITYVDGYTPVIYKMEKVGELKYM